MALTLADLGYDAPQWGDRRLRLDVWERIRVDPDTGCWLWLGALNTDGYGKYRGTSAHLSVFRALCGPTPPDRIADHHCHDPRKCRGGRTCRHRRCSNPACLHWVTRKGQLVPGRRNRWGREFEAGAPIDVCKNGCEFTPENTRWNLSRGVWVRRCKACSRETARHWQARQRGKDPGPFAPRPASAPRKKPPLRTHCSHGRLYTPENIYLRPDGRGRECRCPEGNRPRGVSV